MEQPTETHSATRDGSQFQSSPRREESRGQPLLSLPIPTSPPVPTPRVDSPRSPQDWSKNTITSSPPQHSQSPSHSHPRQNQVSHVMLHGILIVSLNIDGKERLCLAQISNTLLKDYSYNEIHNRRVALGITCVQCTPVQLEILRRAGAMPVSSRRCGMITKREAERLVKSFLEDTEPPKLPEDFAFQVYHECGWGCHGYFEPARYNSSRAKCIKCGYCSVYFSPNKFIFHFHRVAEAKYHHPDAANFNSWRRHLKLAIGVSDDETHLWEDVKAMFNGGTRKKIFSSAPRTSSSSSHSDSSTSSGEPKKKVAKLSSHNSDMQVTPKHPFPTHTFNPYTWGYGHAAKPSYPFVSVNTSQSLCFGFPPPPPGTAKDNVPPDNGILKGGMTPLPSPWLGRSHLPFSNMDAFWDKAFGLPRPLGNGGPPFRGGMFPPPVPKSPSGGAATGNGGHFGEGLSEERRQQKEEGAERQRDRRERPVSSLDLSRDPHSPRLTGNHGTHNNGGNLQADRLSAFRPVGRNSAHAVDDDVHSCGSDAGADADVDETEEIDVMEEDCVSPQDLSQPELREAPVVEEGEQNREAEEAEEATVADGEAGQERESESQYYSDGEELPEKRHGPCQDDVTAPEIEQDVIDYSKEEQRPNEAEDERGNVQRVEEEGEDRQAPGADDSGLSDESEADGDNEDSNLLTMSKEELCHSLKKEVCHRKKKEKEVSMLRETFQEEVTREKAFRDQMARQLEVLRETLTNELEQERKVRYSLQQKLKEAHDALHSFSCSMLTAARDGCGFKDTVLPR